MSSFQLEGEAESSRETEEAGTGISDAETGAKKGFGNRSKCSSDYYMGQSNVQMIVSP